MPIRMLTAEDALGWHNALVVLAIERGQPLLQEAGIPKMMVEFPQPMRAGAREYLQGESTVRSPFPRGGGYAESRLPLLHHAFNVLRNEYGVASATDLHAWAERHFSDQKQRQTWQVWARLLPRLAGSYGGSPAIEGSLRADQEARFVQTVAGLFNPSMRERDLLKIATANAIPLSLVERDLLSLEMSDLRPTDVPYMDVVMWLEVALGPERAYKVWKELDAFLDGPDQNAVLVSARAEAVASDIPLEWIVLPW